MKTYKNILHLIIASLLIMPLLAQADDGNEGGGRSGSTNSNSPAVAAPSVKPIVSLSAAPTSVPYNGVTVLTWSATNASSCTASGGWSGTLPVSGSKPLYGLTTTRTYALVCTGSTANTAGSGSLSITVAAKPASGATPVGINLSSVSDWGDRQLTFVDVMKQSRGFANINNPWDPSTNPPPLDANGWPTTDFGVYFITIPYDPLQRPLTASYPSMFGTYTLSFNGQANIGSKDGNQIINQVYNAATNTTTAQVVVGPTQTGLDLEFYNTNNGVQNLQLLRPGYALGTGQVFTTQLLNTLQPFSVLRTMELLNTNSNPVTAWTGRTPVTAPTQQDPRGIAWEYVIQLANAAGKDIWINIPEGVDLTDTTTNNYVIQLATLLKANLNSNLHVYVEYSNEVWNSEFAQNSANLNSAINDVNSGADATLNYDGVNNQWYWGFRRVAHQLVRVSQLFAQVYGQAAINTVIRPVFVFQDVQPFLTEDALRYVNSNFGAPKQYFYAIGGAPYFGGSTSDTTLDGLFANLQTSLNQYMAGFTGLPAYNGGVVWNGVTFKSLAKYFGLKSVTYEGGPDLSQESNSTLAEQAENDPRMNQYVQAELADFYGCGNDLFVYYSLATAPGDTFGVYEDLTVPTEKSAALTTVIKTPLASYNVCSATDSGLLIQ